MKGPYKTLHSFLAMMKQTGIEDMMKSCGWFPACVFQKLTEPYKMEIIFVAIPQKPTVTMDFLIAVLRSALAILGMPKSTSSAGDVMTKIKLWNVVAFKGRLPRMFPMHDLLDVWDQACTVVGHHLTMRLVSHVGAVNPDMALKHYSRCGDNDETSAFLTFVGALHGGGPTPVGKAPANVHELDIQQKNALASFLLSQGAELKDCIPFIDSMLRGAGSSAISSILGQKRIGKKWEGIMQLAQALNIQMPQVAEKIQLAKNKIQKKFHANAKSLPKVLPVDAMSIENGFLLNQDDSSCLQLQKIAPNVSGAVLMHFDDAKPWLERKIVLSQDELALLSWVSVAMVNLTNATRSICRFVSTMNLSLCRVAYTS